MYDTPEWEVIPDSDVIHVWKCSQCGELAYVDPTFYAEAGTPCCSGEGGDGCEGDDMIYVETRIKKEG